MTEPVAYRASERKGDRWLLFNKKPTMNVYEVIEPLYTAEQLQPRVKMTQAEFDEFKLLYNLFHRVTVRGIINTVEYNESKRFTNLKLRLNKTGKDLELIILWVDYDPNNPEATIEIVPDMKWFVRVDSEIPLPDENIYLDDELIVYPHYNSPKSSSHQFDTKEEAEKWTNPLTEAVQLPVED